MFRLLDGLADGVVGTNASLSADRWQRWTADAEGLNRSVLAGLIG